MLILLFLLISRRRKDKNLLEVDVADDIRENVVFYDEEGAGQLLWQQISNNHNIFVPSNGFSTHSLWKVTATIGTVLNFDAHGDDNEI